MAEAAAVVKRGIFDLFTGNAKSEVVAGVSSSMKVLTVEVSLLTVRRKCVDRTGYGEQAL